MGFLQNNAATALAAGVAVPVIAYTILTPTNVLLGIVPAIGLLGLGLLVDRLMDDPGD